MASSRREKLMQTIGERWDELLASVEGLSDENMLEPGVVGTWSVTDILAHVTTWEEEALKHLPEIAAGKPQQRYKDVYGGLDAFNALKFEENRTPGRWMRCGVVWSKRMRGCSRIWTQCRMSCCTVASGSALGCGGTRIATIPCMPNIFGNGGMTAKREAEGPRHTWADGDVRKFRARLATLPHRDGF